MPRQIPTALALFFVVAFGSSLDVAAIQQDSPEPLDYNRELVTVGQCFCNHTSSVLLFFSHGHDDGFALQQLNSSIMIAVRHLARRKVRCVSSCLFGWIHSSLGWSHSCFPPAEKTRTEYSTQKSGMTICGAPLMEASH